MTRYRIACLFPGIYRGGSDQVLFNLTQGLQELGHHVSYFSSKTPAIQMASGLPEVHIPRQWLGKSIKQLTLWQLSRMIRQEERLQGDFDLILSNIQMRKALSVKNPERLFYFLHMDAWASIQCQYANDPKKLNHEKKRLQDYYRKKNVISVSQGATYSLLNNIHASPTLIKTIYNPFDFAWIQHQSEAYKPDITEPYLIHVGRFDPQKRHDLLFDAYRRLQNPPKLVLLVAITEPLTAMIAQYGLTHQVILPGLQANPFPWIKGAKALILSSDFEALPTVLIESLICDTPVVSTDCPSGPNEILTGDLAHWLVPVNEPIALAHKIQEVLDHPYSINLDQIRQFDMSVVLPQYLALTSPSEVVS